MNRIHLLMFFVIAGCSYPPKTIDTSGPHPSLGGTQPMTAEAKDAEVDTGLLVVFTPRVLEDDPIDLSAPPLTQHTGYSVYTPDGRLVAHEDNHGVRMEGPVERKLAPGRYFVRLDEPVEGRDFWVTVERARVTRVENRSWRAAPPPAR